MKPTDLKEFEDDVKKEFQLERMILFSDAVFAIVITLMAIEIHIPETEGKMTADELAKALLHLAPVFVAYVVSFIFIGLTWYKHLELFGYLKKYDGGLVFRNLLLLFSIGLFPFGASVMLHPVKNSLNFLPYFIILAFCVFSQFLLRYYVLVKHPELRNDLPIDKPLRELKAAKSDSIIMGTALVLFIITGLLVNSEYKSWATFWFIPAAIWIRILRYRASRKAKLITLQTEH